MVGLGMGIGIGLGSNFAPVSGAAAASAFDPAHTSSDITLSPDKLTASRNTNAGGFWAYARVGPAKVSGEISGTINSLGANGFYLGFDTGAETSNLGHDPAGGSIGWSTNTGQIFLNNALITTVATLANADPFKLVKATNSVSFYKGASLLVTINTADPQYAGGPQPIGGAAYPTVADINNTSSSVTVVTGAW